MSERIDFSGNATIYDHRHGAAVSDDGLDRLWVAAGLRTGGRVLDIGAGTGRVAIPLAIRGCNVVAVEPARSMLDQLKAKAGDTKVLAVIAEGSQLPFSAGQFDCVAIARLLYLTPDWHAIVSEVHRVLAPGGRFSTSGATVMSLRSGCRFVRRRGGYLKKRGYKRRSILVLAPKWKLTDSSVSFNSCVKQMLESGPARRSRSGSFFDVSSRASCRTYGACLKTFGRTVFQDLSTGPRRCSILIGPFRCLGKLIGPFIERIEPCGLTVRRVKAAISEHTVRPLPRSPPSAMQRGNRTQHQGFLRVIPVRARVRRNASGTPTARRRSEDVSSRAWAESEGIRTGVVTAVHCVVEQLSTIARDQSICSSRASQIACVVADPLLFRVLAPGEVPLRDLRCGGEARALPTPEFPRCRVLRLR